MRKKLYLLFLVILIVLTELTFGKNGKKFKITEATHKKNSKDKANNNRSKRSVDYDNESPSWTKGKKLLIPNPNYDTRYENLEKNEKNIKNSLVEKESPFWGTRGRRDSSSSENAMNYEYPTIATENKYYSENCKHCYKSSHISNNPDYEYSKERRDELISPFWGNRGRRNSDEAEDPKSLPFVSSIKDRNGEDEPFWGNRGRRLDEEPFWGNRGRRGNNYFSGNRDQHQDTPFWGNRGRRDDNEPFWGNRGRRQESEPFWGNRGRRQESEPFWGNRGRRTNSRDKQREILKESILLAINNVQNEIENLSRYRRSNVVVPVSFWNGRGRESKLKYLFNGDRYKVQVPNFINRALNFGKIKPSQSSTILDDRIFAEQPRYILVERSSRSSNEDDPFFISRGKKKFHSFELFKAARDRRGSIEELVKSVRNDPYYIARGKKDTDNVQIGNSTVMHEDFGKAKELICATIDLIMIKNEVNKVKRDVSDNDRDRRTILKKLAAQLQIDPYFVSRGKKTEDSGVDETNFINEISAKCH